jgi:hypothetical protein
MAEELIDMQRKRDAQKIKAEKEAEKKERERLKLELLKDKAERLSSEGKPVPPELTAEIHALSSGAKPHADVAAPALPRPQALEAALKQIAAYKSPGTSLTAAKTLRTLCHNALSQPAESKFQSINLANQAIRDRVTSLVGGVAFLKAAGA